VQSRRSFFILPVTLYAFDAIWRQVCGKIMLCNSYFQNRNIFGCTQELFFKILVKTLVDKVYLKYTVTMLMNLGFV